MYFMVRITEALKQGDLICIVSPAGKIDGLLIDEAAQFLSQEGFHVEIAPHAKSTYHKFSGTDAQRLDDLQSAINNPKVKAILCARGGYGSMRILDKIEWKAFDKSSKFLIGFSDITAIHQSLYLKGIASVHGIMAKDIARGEMAVKQNLLDLLKGKTQGISIPTHPYNRKASVVAPLIGGNLSILYALRGTAYDVNWDAKILFIEDIAEDLYHLDRIMQNFRLGGKLTNLAGLVVGQFTDMTDVEFGKQAYDIIHEYVSDFNYPLCYNAPIGHVDNTISILHGADYMLDVSETHIILEQK
jgi:muramoyltetrapeptide carboxypeptidase